MGALSKAKVLTTLFKCAEQYEKELINHSLLFVYIDKNKKVSYLEVTFDASNFLHLTGCKINTNAISALDFYSRCLEQRLSVNDFELAKDGTTELKLQILPFLFTKNLSANSVGNFNNSRPKLYTEKLAGGIKGCMGFVQTAPSGRYVPNTVVNTDIRELLKASLRIIVTYRKNAFDRFYKEIVYVAKKVDWSQITYPEEISDLPKPVV